MREGSAARLVRYVIENLVIANRLKGWAARRLPRGGAPRAGWYGKGAALCTHTGAVGYTPAGVCTHTGAFGYTRGLGAGRARL